MVDSDPIPPGVAHFVAVAETGSFRGAAARLGLSPAAVSKGVSRLEETLGARLLERSTRSVSLTDAGRAWLEHSRRALDALASGRDLVRATSETVQGTLRLSLSPVLSPWISSLLPRLLDRHPRLRVALSVTDRQAELVREELDLALRLGDLDDSALVARRLRAPRWVCVASPAYLARHGAPDDAADLSGHRLLRFRGPDGQLTPWRMGERAVDPVAAVEVDHGPALVEGALAGLGIARVFDFMVAGLVADGRLVPVLPALEGPGPPLHALTLPGRQRVPRVRAMLDLLAETSEPLR